MEKLNTVASKAFFINKARREQVELFFNLDKRKTVAIKAAIQNRKSIDCVDFETHPQIHSSTFHFAEIYYVILHPKTFYFSSIRFRIHL